MNRNANESAVDRLIALATDEKPVPRPSAAVETPERPTELEPLPPAPSFADDLRDLEHNPMWKALMQFRVLVPYVARLLEVGSNDAARAPVALSPELKQTVMDLQAFQRDLQTSQRDLRTVVQDQMLQMKRVEEDTARIRQAAERSATETAELAEDVKGVKSQVRMVGTGIGVLLVVLIALVILLLARMPH